MIQGGCPTRNRHRWSRLHVRGRVQRPQGRPRRAGDGERRPEHERLAVLHRHRRGVRRGSTASTPSSARSRAGWTSSTRSRPCDRRPRRADRAGRAAGRRTRLSRGARGPGSARRGRNVRPCAAPVACLLTPRQNRQESQMASVEQVAPEQHAPSTNGHGIPVENPATGRSSRTCRTWAPTRSREWSRRPARAQPGWEALGFEGRGRVLLRAQRWLIDNRERVIETIVVGDRQDATRTRSSPSSPTAPARSASGPKNGGEVPRPTRRSSRPTCSSRARS